MKNLLLLELALLSLVATAFADTLPTDGNFYAWSFGGVGSTGSPTFTANFATDGTVEVTDFLCAGDQFEVFIDNVSQGKTSTPIPGDGCATATGDPDLAMSDSRWSSGRFFVKAGTHTITFKAVQSPFGGGSAEVKAVLGLCQGPPGISSDKFAVVFDTKVGFSSYPDKCAQFGLDPAQVTSANIQLASQTAIQCSKDTPLWVKSWNSDTYGGTYPLAFYPSKNAPYGNVAGTASSTLYSLCQRKPAAIDESFAGYQTFGRSPDQKLFIVGPPMPYAQTGSACASFSGAVPAVLHAAQQTLYSEASALTFSVAGPNGKAWIGGWETATPNTAYALSAGATSGPGAVNPADPTTSLLYVVCAVPGSGADKKRRSVDEL